MVPKPLKGRCGGERAGDPSVVPEQIRVTGGERDDRGMDARSEGSDQTGVEDGNSLRAHYLGPEDEPDVFDLPYEDGYAERLTAAPALAEEGLLCGDVG